MQSKHAMVLSLLLGAFAFVFCLGALLAYELSTIVAGNTSAKERRSGQNYERPPILISKIEGPNAVIAEVDQAGNTIRPIYTSSLLDNVSDFSIFAIPQEHYTGRIYVQSVIDTKLSLLKLYPLIVETGELEPSILNVPYDSYTLSGDQEFVTIVKDGNVSIYDLKTGKVIVQ